MSYETIFPRDRVTIVGVLNITPDSFSDGGRLLAGEGRPDAGAVSGAAQELLAAGAHVLDVGGESTRPGATCVSAAVELARVLPVIEQLACIPGVLLSVDTRKAEVARAALAAGARLVNDVSGLGFDPDLAFDVARAGAGLVLGHMRGTPQTMQIAPRYEDVLAEVAAELEQAIGRAQAAGLSREQLAVDPGLGFGKRVEDNLRLLAHVGWLRERLGLPVLVGPSRKAFLGSITGDPVGERDVATQAACAVAAFCGADAVRVHDAAGARRAVAVGRALRGARRKELS